METITEFDDYAEELDSTIDLAQEIFQHYITIGNNDGIFGMVETLINSLSEEQLALYQEAYAEHLDFLNNGE